jgi:hypothetical protein
MPKFSHTKNRSLVFLGMLAGFGVAIAFSVWAASTISTDISTDGALTVNGSATSTFAGGLSIGGAITHNQGDVNFAGYFGSSFSSFSSAIQSQINGSKYVFGHHGSSANQVSTLTYFTETTDNGSTFGSFGGVVTTGNGRVTGGFALAGNSGSNLVPSARAWDGYINTFGSGGITEASVYHAADGYSPNGASGKATDQYGFNVDDLTFGTSENIGFYSALSAGTGKWAFYGAGTAATYFGGNVGIGTTTPASTFSVSTSGTRVFSWGERTPFFSALSLSVLGFLLSL